MMTSKVKSLIAAIFLLSLCMYTGAKDQEINQTEAVFVSGSPITTSALSPEYDLTKIKPHGFFSLQVDLSAGDDITHIQVEVSNGGGIFSIATVLVEGTYTDKIFETFTTASGPGSDGVDSIQIGIPIARIIRFRLFSARRRVEPITPPLKPRGDTRRPFYFACPRGSGVTGIATDLTTLRRGSGSKIEQPVDRRKSCKKRGLEPRRGLQRRLLHLLSALRYFQTFCDLK